jgi:spore coat polysaccharide biosynthesis predicted glycosyltransferase SpsG
MPWRATIVAADESLRRDLLALQPGPEQELEVIAPTDRLPELLAAADLVLSASGTSTWELLCLGLPSALVWVVDNQILGYERATARGLAAGLGHLPALTEGGTGAGAAVDVLRHLLTSPEARTALATRAWAAVDGLGPARVAEALRESVLAGQSLRPAPQ